MIKGLHHNAYRCHDSEETRAFYDDFLGLRMVSAFEINEGRALHTFFEMDDGSCLAFFEVPGSPFDFKRQDSLDLHIALGSSPRPSTPCWIGPRPRVERCAESRYRSSGSWKLRVGIGRATPTRHKS
jgi:catechol 2,3-dioxygenase-like lactoylglutathione lyase family enzyme